MMTVFLILMLLVGFMGINFMGIGDIMLRLSRIEQALNIKPVTEEETNAQS